MPYQIWEELSGYEFAEEKNRTGVRRRCHAEYSQEDQKEVFMDTYLIIQKHIINGIFKPGERLTEQNLAEMFNVSRTPIRQALKQLEKFIEFTNG